MITQEKAVAGTTAQSNTKRKYHRNILADSIERVKKRFNRIATSFWRFNYTLEESRQEHAALGHLWRQIGCCLSLLVFRIFGRAFK